MTDSLERWLGGSTVRFCVALAIANAPFWLYGDSYFSHRGAVNVDIAVALLVLVARPIVGAVLLILAWAADIVLAQSLIFHFATPMELVRSLKFSSALQVGEYFSRRDALLAIPFLVSGAALLRLTRNRPDLLRPAYVVIVLLVIVDALNGSSLLTRRDQWRIPFNVAGSPIATMTTLQLRYQDDVPLRALPVEETVQGFVDVAEWAAHHPGSSVLFVIVESLGMPRAAPIQRWLEQRMSDPSIEDRFDVRIGEVPFRGSTTSGELRSLCGLSGSYRELDEASGSRCLPSRLARMGWTTIGMHGFSGRMFDRRAWWPLIGLQELEFADSPPFATGQACGELFKGACDAQVVDAGVEALSPGKRFVYLLTLNTHLPLVPGPLPSELESLCRNSSVDLNACRLTGALGNVLDSVRSAVSRLKHQPLVIVIGDHAPPFASKASRDDFIADIVPAFALVPRD